MVSGIFKRQVGGRRQFIHKMMIFCLVLSTVLFASFKLHPYFLSVTEIEYQPQEKTIQIASKIFTDDFEDALRKEFNVKIEILSASEKKKNEALINMYFQKHLKLFVNGKQLQFELVGFEKQEEAIWTYLEVKNVSGFKSITVFNDLLYQYRQDQINIIHCKYNNDRKSYRLTYPDKEVSFSF
jgi:hypothetical protein